MGYIYLRKNLSNGKCYVGQTVDIKVRQSRWNNLNHPYAGKAINAARAKYGIDTFDFEILRECGDDELNQWEMYYIKELNTKVPYGYNMTDGGDSVYEITEETRKKMSVARRGKKQSPETKAKLSAALRGRKFSEEAKAKMSAAQRGRKQTTEFIEKRVAKLRGRKRPAEVGAKVAAAHRGKHYPKISAAKSKPVQALDPKTLEVIHEFPSTIEAERQGYSSGHVSACCRNCYLRSGNNVYKGYIWRYKENAQEQ